MSEHNIFHEIDEDLERQRLEALWKRYGGFVLAAALVAVIATGAITFWHSYRDSRDQAATAMLVQLENSTDGDTHKQVDALKAFADKNPGASQAAFAQFHAAKLAMSLGDKDKALQIYNDIAQNSAIDKAFRQLADLLAVRTQMDSADPAMLSQRLEPLTAEGAPYRFTAMEYQGYLALKVNDKVKARTLFTELAQNATVPHSLAQRATDMMHYVSE
jgi:hypothetical protein